MITEDYVSYETAKLLKEKGFDVKGAKVWYDESGEMYYDRREIKYQVKIENHEKFFQCPTLQMAMKWLREIHHIFLVVDYNYECTDKSYIYKVYHLGENGKPKRFPVWGVNYDIEGNQHKGIVCHRNFELSYFDYATYDEAADEGIKYCLENLI